MKNFVKNRIVYSIAIFLTGIFSFVIAMQSCSINESGNVGERIDENLLRLPHKTLEEFEYDVALKMSTTVGTNIKMIGFKTIHIDEDSRVGFFNLYKDNQEFYDTIKNIYYDIENSCLRVYFPANEVYVEYNGDLYAASKSGDIRLQNTENLKGVRVIGRKRTDIVRGCGSNIIKGDTIFLAKKVKVNHINDNVLIFDFGEWRFSNTPPDNHVHDHHVSVRLKSSSTEPTPHLEEGGAISCTKNHGSSPNCSVKYNINNGRCTQQTNVCMDYNGYGTDCVNRSNRFNPLRYAYWIGSDCCSAMLDGHCLNED
jgi:hypothetical protein